MRRTAWRTTVAAAWIAVPCAAASAIDGPGSRPMLGEVLDVVLDEYCLHCHSGDRPKGLVSLESLRASPGDASPTLMRSVRDRVQRGDMPPSGKERPDEATYAVLVNELNSLMDERARRASPGRTTLRRLNRVEYRNAVRDLTGVDLPVASVLPADDVGDGFDHIGDVLSMSPILLEKYLDCAERVAMEAWPDDVAPTSVKRPGGELEVRGGGRASGGVAVVWSAGAATAAFDLPRAGRYRISVDVCGDQAGTEPVRIALSAGSTRVAHFDVTESRSMIGSRVCEATLAGSRSVIAVEFLNDFYDEALPVGQRDRNLHVHAIAIDGPLDEVAPTPELSVLAGESHDLTPFMRALLHRAFRSEVSEAEATAFLDRIRTALPAGVGDAAVVRAGVVAALVDPRFLFRVEAEPAPGESERRLDGFELATRLSFACWSSSPDELLLESARRGDLDTDEGLRRALARLLDDPRSIAVAEHFGQQWLLIRSVDTKEPDAQRFQGVTPQLLADMKAETTLFLDSMLREERPLRELLQANWTFLNARLAAHYGLSGVDGDWMRRVSLGDRRMPGLLGHGSILVATSNPTRTSPVKRGKWVLEVLLSSPPAPPPPGVPVLAEKESEGLGISMREMLARHRADPSCAACHARMDAIGLTLETLDPVGRERRTIDGRSIDATATLPGGRHVDGPRQLATALVDEPAIVYSVVRHLYVYALGRSYTDEDEAIVDAIARSLGPNATLRAALEAIVLSRPFRVRAAAKEESS